MSALAIPPVNDVPQEALGELRKMCKEIVGAEGYTEYHKICTFSSVPDYYDADVVHREKGVRILRLYNCLLSIGQCAKILGEKGLRWYPDDELYYGGWRDKQVKPTTRIDARDPYDLPSIIRATHKAVFHAAE